MRWVVRRVMLSKARRGNQIVLASPYLIETLHSCNERSQVSNVFVHMWHSVISFYTASFIYLFLTFLGFFFKYEKHILSSSGYLFTVWCLRDNSLLCSPEYMWGNCIKKRYGVTGLYVRIYAWFLSSSVIR